VKNNTGKVDPDRDEALLEKLRSGDRKAFESFVEAYQDMVYNVALSMVHDRELAEDVSQAAFMKAYRGLRSFRGGSSLSTWVYRIAYNTALSELQRARYRYEKPEFADADQVCTTDPAGSRAIGEAAADPLTILEKSEASRRLRGCIDTLKPRQRLALLLYYQGGKSYSDISGIMEIPMGSVKNTIFRAKESLRKLLSKEDT